MRTNTVNEIDCQADAHKHCKRDRLLSRIVLTICWGFGNRFPNIFIWSATRAKSIGKAYQGQLGDGNPVYDDADKTVALPAPENKRAVLAPAARRFNDWVLEHRSASEPVQVIEFYLHALGSGGAGRVLPALAPLLKRPKRAEPKNWKPFGFLRPWDIVHKCGGADPRLWRRPCQSLALAPEAQCAPCTNGVLIVGGSAASRSGAPPADERIDCTRGGHSGFDIMSASPSSLASAVGRIVASLAAGKTVVLWCSQGAHRSAALAVAVVACLDECTVGTAIRRIQGRRACVDPLAVPHLRELLSGFDSMCSEAR